MQNLDIGLIGLDTSHAPAFARLLNNAAQPHHVAGGRVVAAFAGGSPDFALSKDRVEQFSAQVRDESGVRLLDSPAAVAKTCDAIILTSVDGRVHLEQFREIVPFGKPVFIDKPLATTSADARAILDLAREYNIAVMSASNLRYADSITEALAAMDTLVGADCCGPMNLEATQPGLFWYGIHAVELLYTALGPGCQNVRAVTTENSEFVTGVWRDGRIGTVRGYRGGKSNFGALLHGAKGSRFVDIAQPKPAYASLLEQALQMFQGGAANPPIEDSLEIVRFIEAANESRASGETVNL